jgi:hypothetical protein
MLARTEPACLVIADIAGYSGYLAGVELDHAQDILADLIDTVVGALRPSFKLTKLEGDAAFVFLPAATVDGPGLRDVVERCYYAFQRRVRDIRQASTCECNACLRMPTLDLKFVAHHGLVARQRMAGTEELIGSDVVLVHRLLKNHVTEELGISAYSLFTQALTRAMGLDDPAATGMREHRETFESVGEVVSWVSDLAAAWEEERRRGRTKVTDEDALTVMTIPTPIPRDILWEWATSPARRIRWTTGMTDLVEDTTAGRRGIGTVNHCVHGKDVTIEEVLDWVPPEYVTKRVKLPVRAVPRIVVTMELIAHAPDQTDLVWRVARPRSVKDRLIVQALEVPLRTAIRRDSASLVELAAADARERAAGRATEPDVPASAARFLSEPLVAAVTPIAYVPDEMATPEVPSAQMPGEPEHLT